MTTEEHSRAVRWLIWLDKVKKANDAKGMCGWAAWWPLKTHTSIGGMTRRMPVVQSRSTHAHGKRKDARKGPCTEMCSTWTSSGSCRAGVPWASNGCLMMRKLGLRASSILAPLEPPQLVVRLVASPVRRGLELPQGPLELRGLRRPLVIGALRMRWPGKRKRMPNEEDWKKHSLRSQRNRLSPRTWGLSYKTGRQQRQSCLHSRWRCEEKECWQEGQEGQEG